MKRHFYLLIIISFLGITSHSLAQTGQLRQYTVNDGLPSAIVYNILQDRAGYMWFATENGLAKFDGKNFKTYTRNDGLTDNLILRLFEDRIGRIWITSFTGKLCYYLNGKIHNPTNDTILAQMPTLSISVAFPAEDKNGVVYFGNQKSFFALKGNRLYYSKVFNSISHPGNDLVYPYTPDYLPFNINSDSQPLKELSHFPFVRKNYYHSGPWLINRLKQANLPVINTIQYQKLIKNDLWFTSSDNGAFQVSDINSGKATVKQYLPGLVINDVYCDNENNLWFSTTGKGLYFLGGNAKNAIQKLKSAELPQENINALYRAKNHIIWVGAINNYLYRIKDHKIHLYYSNSGKDLINYCYGVVGDDNGNIYFANNENLTSFNQHGKENILQPSVLSPYPYNRFGNYKSLSVSRDGNVLTNNPFKLLIFEPNTAIGKNHLMRIMPAPNNKRILTSFITSDGKIWAANSEGLYSLIGGKWIPNYPGNDILKEPISKIAELNDGNLIITTRSKGVALFDGHSVKQQLTENEGIASDICNRVFTDGKNIWVATARGVSHIVYENGKLKFIRNYTTNDGLLSNEINDVVSDNDTLYIATAEGLTILPEIKISYTPSPSVYISSIQYGSTLLSSDHDTILKYENNYVKFNFIGITYQQPKNVLYKYRLQGASLNWELNSSGAVDYPSLAPGDYIFEVMAKKADSDWSRPTRFHFIIKAPFWMQGWFYFLLYTLLFIALGIIFYVFSRLKRRENEKKFAIQKRMAQLEQQALGALMNPHFIFNALNSIQQYLHQNDTLAANKYLSLFAKLTRQNMEAIVKNNVSLEEELERLELYLKFEKLRFGDKLKYHLEIPQDLETDEIDIPPMVLQPFVENAIWHGLMPLDEGGIIFISATKLSPTQYKIEIKDTGIGIENSRELKKSQGLNHKSKGMQLTIERLELWAKGLNTKVKLEIGQGTSKNSKNPGTLVSIILPLQLQVLRKKSRFPFLIDLALFFQPGK